MLHLNFFLKLMIRLEVKVLIGVKEIKLENDQKQFYR